MSLHAYIRPHASCQNRSAPVNSTISNFQFRTFRELSIVTDVVQAFGKRPFPGQDKDKYSPKIVRRAISNLKFEIFEPILIKWNLKSEIGDMKLLTPLQLEP